MFTVNVKADVVVHMVDPEARAALERIERVLGIVSKGVKTIMGAVTDLKGFLNELNEYTNKLAAAQQTQVEKIEEIGKDIDDLLANVELDDETKARIETLRATLTSIGEAEQLQAEQLTAIAAKHDTPLPEIPEGGGGQ
jgi:methyl-accepting chemotaxis protein